MFDMLADRLGKAVDALRGRGRLTEENIADTLRQVRMALLEADVAVPVVKSFTEAARARAIGAEVMKSLTPGQALIGIIHEELTRVMGPPGGGLNLHADAAGRRVARGTAGRRQDDDGRQACAPSHREASQEAAAGEHRRLSPGGDDATRASRRPGRGGVTSRRRRARSRSRSRWPRSTMRAVTSTMS